MTDIAVSSLWTVTYFPIIMQRVTECRDTQTSICLRVGAFTEHVTLHQISVLDWCSTIQCPPQISAPLENEQKTFILNIYTNLNGNWIKTKQLHLIFCATSLCQACESSIMCNEVNKHMARDLSRTTFVDFFSSSHGFSMEVGPWQNLLSVVREVLSWFWGVLWIIAGRSGHSPAKASWSSWDRFVVKGHQRLFMATFLNNLWLFRRLIVVLETLWSAILQMFHVTHISLSQIHFFYQL